MFQNRLCEKFSLETLVQSISQPHKISPLHFYNIREVVNYPNQSSSIRFDSIRFSLYSTQFDSVHFFKFGIRFDLIRLNRIESNRIIRQFDSLSVSEQDCHIPNKCSCDVFIRLKKAISNGDRASKQRDENICTI